MSGSSIPYRAVVFDLDGTLIDSLPDIASALNEVMERHGLARLSAPEVETMIGGGVAQLLGRALRARGAAAGLVPAAVDEFLAAYRARCVVKTRLYDGALDLLRRLHARNIGLGICTNKPHDITVRILDGLGIAHFFGAVTGERPELPRKPNPAPLRLVLAQLGVVEADAVMVGDSAADVGAARACGMPAVLVDFGYTSVPARELGADAVIGNLAELEGVLATMRRT